MTGRPAGAGRGDPPFTGVGVALATLFHPDGELDAAGTAALAVALVGHGVRAVLVAGSTGEAAALTRAERGRLLAAVRAAVPDVPLLAGTGAPSTRQAVALTGDAVAAGADAVVALSPPGAADLTGYYRAVAAATAGRPVLAYHFPRLSAPGVPVAALGGLPVRGVKDSSGDPDRLLDLLVHYPGWVYVGSAALLALAGPLGATGAILALANLAPARCAAAYAGDPVAQRDLAEAHLAVSAGFPGELKRRLAAAYRVSPATRL